MIKKARTRISVGELQIFAKHVVMAFEGEKRIASCCFFPVFENQITIYLHNHTRNVDFFPSISPQHKQKIKASIK